MLFSFISVFSIYCTWAKIGTYFMMLISFTNVSMVTKGHIYKSWKNRNKIRGKTRGRHTMWLAGKVMPFLFSSQKQCRQISDLQMTGIDVTKKWSWSSLNTLKQVDCKSANTNIHMYKYLSTVYLQLTSVDDFAELGQYNIKVPIKYNYKVPMK